MDLVQMEWILQGLTFRKKMLQSLEWLQEGHLTKIRVWGYDTYQDAMSFCDVTYNHSEKILQGIYTSGLTSKWVSPFQCNQFLSKNILMDADEEGMILYQHNKSTDLTNKIMFNESY